jgi:hypothetical protein
MPKPGSKRVDSNPPATSATPKSEAESDELVVTDQQIAERAYYIYLARAGEAGSDLDDWLEAERELRGESASGRD